MSAELVVKAVEYSIKEAGGALVLYLEVGWMVVNQ